MNFRIVLPILASLGLACQEAPTESQLQPNAAAAAKGGGGATSPLVADAVTGDFSSTGGTALVSIGAAGTSKAYAALWKHSRCADITPEGSSYALTDDVTVHTRSRAGKIIAVWFSGQDVIGDAGIMHETDEIPVTPIKPNTSGFTLHVHADAVQVWRLDGHLRGDRVEMIGTISIGDIVYRAGTPTDCSGGA
jgi:hypothetical protein